MSSFEHNPGFTGDMQAYVQAEKLGELIMGGWKPGEAETLDNLSYQARPFVNDRPELQEAAQTDQVKAFQESIHGEGNVELVRVNGPQGADPNRRGLAYYSVVVAPTEEH